MILGEELAGRSHEVGGYPTVRTGDVGSFCIVVSIVRMTPLSDTLRGGSGGQASEGRGYIWSSRDNAHLDAKYVTTSIWRVAIRHETPSDDPFGRTHETISDRLIITDDTFGVGTGWTGLFRSVDM